VQKVVKDCLPNFSFPHHHRLVTKAQYKSLFDKSDKVSQRYLLVLFKKNQHCYGRLGLIVGKRVAKSAVTRNRIKRIIRESFRFNQRQLNGVDVIVIARQQCDELSKADLRKGVDQLWEKLQAYYRKVSLS